MRYSSKLLLFGEHTINRGSHALAIPYPAFGGEWAYSEDFTQQQNLLSLADYLGDLQKKGKLRAAVNVAALRHELAQGLYFRSNIPIGYGLGSSGALCAALYDRFCFDKIERTDQPHFSELKQALAQIESFFHGASSGTDPLICYINQPILIQTKNSIQIVDLPKEKDITFFLLDTQIPRSTEPLVQFFLQRCEASDFLTKVTDKLVWHTNAAIQSFLKGDWAVLFDNVSEISRFQIEELAQMTPENYHVIWQEGLQGNLYRLKMCGAGGGGFILGITFDWKQTQEKLSKYKLLKMSW